MGRRTNVERLQFRGRSYSKGGERIVNLRAKSETSDEGRQDMTKRLDEDLLAEPPS